MKFPALLAALLALTLAALPAHAKSSNGARQPAVSKTTAKASVKGNKAKNIAKIRDAAIRSSVAGLAPLKNYSTNYRALVAAVKSYWHRNIQNPSAAGLASTIMRYVQPAYRKYAAAEVRAGAAEGVASVKLALRNS
jgi:hypothetical protein